MHIVKLDRDFFSACLSFGSFAFHANMRNFQKLRHKFYTRSGNAAFANLAKMAKHPISSKIARSSPVEIDDVVWI